MANEIPEDLERKSCRSCASLDGGERPESRSRRAVSQAHQRHQRSLRYRTRSGPAHPGFCASRSKWRCADRSPILAGPTVCCWCFIAARIGDNTAAPNWSSWNNPVRCWRRTASGSRPSVTIPRRFSNASRTSAASGFRCSRIAIAPSSAALGSSITNMAPGLTRSRCAASSGLSGGAGRHRDPEVFRARITSTG